MKEFIQKKGFSLRKFTLTDNKITVETKTMARNNRYDVKIDMLGTDLHYQSDSRKGKIVIMILTGLGLLGMVIGYFTGNVDGNQLMTFAFMSVIIIIILVSLKHNDDIFLVGGQKNLVFYRNKPSEDKVVEFIEAIKDARKDYFKKSFSSFDKTTTEEEYYGRLQWLKRQEMITADEYDELKHIFDIQKLF